MHNESYFINYHTIFFTAIVHLNTTDVALNADWNELQIGVKATNKYFMVYRRICALLGSLSA